MTTRRRYIPISDAQEGMVLGAPVVLPEHGVSNFSLPAGHQLTASNINQMEVRHAEFVCIEQDDMLSPEEQVAAAAIRAARVNHIFRSADLNNPAMARLHAAIMAFREV